MTKIPNGNEKLLPSKEENNNNNKYNEFHRIWKTARRYALIAIASIIGKEALSQGPNIDPNFPQDSLIFNTIQAVYTDSLENNSTEIQRDERADAENKFAQTANQTDSRLQNIMKHTVYRKISTLIESGSSLQDITNIALYVDTHPTDFPIEDIVNYMPYITSQAGKAAGTPGGYEINVTYGALVSNTYASLYLKCHEEGHKASTLSHTDGLDGVEESAYGSSGNLIETIFNGATIMNSTLDAAPYGRYYYSLNPLYNTGMVANGGTGEFTRNRGGITFTTPAAALNKTPSSTDKLVAYNAAHPETLHKKAVAPLVAPILHLDIPTGRIWIINQADFANYYTGVFHRDTNGVITPATKLNGEHYGTDEIYKWYLKDASNPANLVGNGGFLLSDTTYIDSLNLNLVNTDSLTAHMRSFYSNGKSPDGNNIQTDIEAPSTPTLTANNETPTTIDLNWVASTDLGSGLAGYSVFQDGVEIAGFLPGFTNYTVSGLSELTSYNFHVIATDSAGNESQSAIISATTTDGTAPNVTITASDTLAKELNQNGEANISFSDFATATDASGFTSTISENFANCSDAGETLNINWSVIDNSPSANETVGMQYVRIEENLAPNLVLKSQIYFPVAAGPPPFAMDLPTKQEILDLAIISNTDNCTDAPTVSVEYPAVLQAGENIVGIKSTDENGNEITKEIKVIITTEDIPDGITNPENFKGFQAYPTEGGQNLIIESGESNIKEFFILNSLGQEVLNSDKELKPDEISTYDISYFPAGLYFLKAINEKGEIAVTQKFIKQ